MATVNNATRISLIGAYCRAAQQASCAAQEAFRTGDERFWDEGLRFAAAATTALIDAEALADEVIMDSRAAGALENLERTKASVEAALVEARTLRN